jgi:hypothetical protein
MTRRGLRSDPEKPRPDASGALSERLPSGAAGRSGFRCRNGLRIDLDAGRFDHQYPLAENGDRIGYRVDGFAFLTDRRVRCHAADFEPRLDGQFMKAGGEVGNGPAETVDRACTRAR